MSDSVTPRTVAHKLPLSMEFSRQEYWSGLPLPSPEDLPDPGIEQILYHLSHQGSPLKSNTQFILVESKGLNYIHQVEKRLSKPLKAVLKNSGIIFQIKHAFHSFICLIPHGAHSVGQQQGSLAGLEIG